MISCYGVIWFCIVVKRNHTYLEPVLTFDADVTTVIGLFSSPMFTLHAFRALPIFDLQFPHPSKLNITPIL